MYSGGSHSVGEIASQQMALMHGGGCCLLTREEDTECSQHGGGPPAELATAPALSEATRDLERAAPKWALGWGAGERCSGQVRGTV